jgi:hypothetical protein
VAQCGNCTLPLAATDAFCGNCGTRAPEGSRASYLVETATPANDGAGPPPVAAPRMSSTVTTQASASAVSSTRLDVGGGASAPSAEAFSGQFFRHATKRPEGRLSSATRYLCAAAYLNPDYANGVIGELVASSRAVVPSIGFDLGPIIRHSLAARKIQVARDAAIVIMLLISLSLATLPTIGVVAVAFIVALLPEISWKHLGLRVRMVTALMIIGMLAIVVGLLILAPALGGGGVAAFPKIGVLGSGKVVLVVVVVLILILAAIVLASINRKYNILAQQLQPGGRTVNFDRSSDHIESRISEIEAAQWGNMVLYAGQNPFIGSGSVNRAWSIAIELDRARPAGMDAWSGSAPKGYVPIDPVDLHRTIRDRLLKLKDADLPENERVSALEVEDHIVGEGRSRRGGPLMDPSCDVPYSEVAPEAITALICHPQAGLRYYQRVSVNDEGQAVVSRGNEILSCADQEISVSAFVYVAVEGRMLYVEFVATVLPPVQRRYHVIDLLGRLAPGKLLGLIVKDSARELFPDIMRAPFQLVDAFRLILRENASTEDKISSVDEFLDGDTGARISVRELGAAPDTETYMQQLDAAKYTKIIERMLNDTVLDFLVAKGVDTTAYRASANTVINNGTVISGGTVNGTVVGGLGATANVTQSQTVPAPAAG